MAKVTKYMYNPEDNKIETEEVQLNWFDKLVMKYDDTVKDIKHSRIRRKALNGIADYTLRDVYEEIEIAKQAKKSKKEAAKRTKLEVVVDEASI